MNAKERAEKVWLEIARYHDKRCQELIAAQISEAEREAYKEGWNAAREKAKGIAENIDCEADWGCCMEGNTIADRISQMSPEEPEK